MPSQEASGKVAGWIALAVLILVASVLVGSCSSTPPEKPTADGKKPADTNGRAAIDDSAGQTTAESGSDLYARHCAACHGKTGDGQGVATPYLFPKPRDIRSGRFRLVSTKNNVPTREDLHAVLLRGMPGSSMPPWRHLSDAQRDLLVDEVLRLYREGSRDQYIAVLKNDEGFSDTEIQAADVQADIQSFVERRTTPGEATEVPPIGESSPDRIARGKDIYFKQSCHSCHGNEGRGDGQQVMVDDEGLPTEPRDFLRGVFKGGHDAASLYRRIAYGMPGTPMPSSQQLTPQQSADLVHFILSLSEEHDRQMSILNRERIVAQRVATLPADAHSPVWDEIYPVHLRTVPLWWRNDADRELRVQAVHDGTSIAIRLTWNDDQADASAARTESFEDAIALELFRGESEPFLGMGDPTAPVDVWYWDADRQSPLAVEQVYPNTVVDVFPFSEAVVASAELDRDGARSADQPDVSLPAKASGNPIVAGSGSGASGLSAGGPGSVTFRIPTSRHVTATGAWKDGRWTVVMARPLAVESESDGVSLEAGGRASMAFAIWDGAHGDRDGKKLVTIWQDLQLEP